MPPTANPTGADPSGIFEATEKISQILSTEPEGQPGEGAAPAPANPEAGSEPVYDEATGRYRDPATNKFVKGPEQETEAADAANEGPQEPSEEGADVDEATDTSEAEDDEFAELADTLDGLAGQLGLEPEELAASLKATVRVNGEEQQVTLDELRNGYQMEADYRRKTAAHADEKREFETERDAFAKQRDEFSSRLEPLVAQLEQDAKANEDYLNQLYYQAQQSGDWDTFNQYKFAADQQASKLAQAKEAQAKLEQEKAQENQNKLKQAVSHNEQLLSQLKPEWAKDPDKGREGLKAIRQYLKSEGFAAQDVDGLFDARTLVMAEKAMKFDALKKTDVKTKLKAATKKVIKPGPARSVEDPKKKVRRENLNRLRQRGSVRDAAPVFKDVLGL